MEEDEFCYMTIRKNRVYLFARIYDYHENASMSYKPCDPDALNRG